MTDQESGETTQPEFGGTASDKETTNEPDGKFGKEDLDKVLKQNFHAQEHIKTLETERNSDRDQIKTLQEKLAAASTIDDILADMQTVPTNNQPESKTPQLDPEALISQLKKEVFSELSQAQQEGIEQTNWDESLRLAKDKYGEKFASIVDTKAFALDMPNEQVETLAKTSPKAFMELFGDSSSSSPAPTTPSSTGALGAVEEYNYAKLARLKAENTEDGQAAKRLWSDTGFQQKYRTHIIDQAKKHGSEFGNRF